jgi:hypothetical protein
MGGFTAMTTTAPINTQGKSITELVQMLMPAAHERRARHVSTTDKNPTVTVDAIQRGTGKHRAEPIAAALYLESTPSTARHRADHPDSLFALVNSN